MHTIIEPFRVKMTEALPITTRGHREACLASTSAARRILRSRKAARRKRRSGRKNDGGAP